MDSTVSTLWPGLGHSKTRVHNTDQSHGFAGAVRKQKIPLLSTSEELQSNSSEEVGIKKAANQILTPSKGIEETKNDDIHNPRVGNEETVKGQTEFQEWKQIQKLKRQARKEEKRLLREEEVRKQLIAPKGYRVQLVSAPKSAASSSPALASPVPGDFPALGSPGTSHSRSNCSPLSQLPRDDNSPQTRLLHARRREPMLVDLDSIIQQRAKKLTQDIKKPPKSKKTEQVLSGNPLDSSQPVRHRGKVRENPKPKKPTTLKKVVLKNRLTKKLLRDEPISSDNFETSIPLSENSAHVQDSDENALISEPADQVKSDQDNNSLNIPTEESKDNLKIGSKTCASNFQQFTKTDAIHSLRFREYCDHSLSPSLDASVTNLLKQLIALQNRAHEKDPEKAKSKRRILTGMHETKKFLKIKKVSLLIIAPDLEKCPLPGGLDSKIQELLEIARAEAIPYIFCLGRRKFGRLLFKKVPVSCIAVLNVEGAESELAVITSLLPGLRASYNNLLASSSLPSVPAEMPQERDVNEIVVTSLLTALEESLQIPKLSPFLQVIENMSQDEN